MQIEKLKLIPTRYTVNWITKILEACKIGIRGRDSSMTEGSSGDILAFQATSIDSR